MRDYNYIMYYEVPSGNILKTLRVQSALTPVWYQMQLALYDDSKVDSAQY